MGGATGFSPAQIKEMSIVEFLYAADGWRKSNGIDGDSDGPKPPSEEEFFAKLESLGID